MVSVTTRKLVTHSDEEARMEFHENRHSRPFIGFVLVARWLKRWWERHRTRRILSTMSDAQLRDLGLSRDDVRHWR
jgi:uncharacterized protein YjiS (DUF1127 family)